MLSLAIGTGRVLRKRRGLWPYLLAQHAACHCPILLQAPPPFWPMPPIRALSQSPSWEPMPQLLFASPRPPAGAAAFLANATDAGALTKAIVGAISSVDAYQLPDAKGYTALTCHILQITDEERQQRR